MSQPFILSSTRLKALQTSVDARLSVWQADWVPDQATHDKLQNIVAAHAIDVPGKIWWEASASPSGRNVFIGGSSRLPLALLSALSGGTATHPVSQLLHDWIAACLQSLVERLLDESEIRMQRCEPPASTLRYGSGAALFTIGVAGEVMYVVLPASVVTLLAPVSPVSPASPGLLTNRGTAVGNGVVQLECRLSPIEIKAAAFSSLLTGTLLVTDHPISAPLKLHSRQGAVLGQGFMGRVQDQRALKLAR